MPACSPTHDGRFDALRLLSATVSLVAWPLGAGFALAMAAELAAGLAAPLAGALPAAELETPGAAALDGVDAGAAEGAAAPPQALSKRVAVKARARMRMRPRYAIPRRLVMRPGRDVTLRWFRMAAVAEAVPIGGTAAHISDEQLRSIRRRTAGLLFTSQIFGSGGTTAALTVATILAASILGSSTWAGLPNSVRTLGAALFAIPLSTFMVRTGRRKGLLLGYAVGTVGGALCVISAVASNYPLLLIGSAVFGAGYAANLLSRYASADVTPASQRG